MSRQQIPGLPNIGNTCFLNSVIQQIYAMSIVRQKLKLTSEDELDGKPLLKEIKKLFSVMNEQRKNPFSDTRSRPILERITKQLEKLLNEYHFGDQFDSLQIFLNILDQLFIKNVVKEQLFKIDYSIKCSCSHLGSRNLKDIKIEPKDSTCTDCNKTMKRTIRNNPDYLFVVYGKGQELIRELREQGKYYQMESMNFYIGSGKSGHYYSVCKCENGKTITFNDAATYSYDQRNERGQVKFAIYKKTTKPPSLKEEIGDCIQSSEDNPWKKRIFFVGSILIIIAVIIFCAVYFTTDKSSSSSSTQKSYQLLPSKAKSSNLLSPSEKDEHVLNLTKENEQNQEDSSQPLAKDESIAEQINLKSKLGKKQKQPLSSSKRNHKSSEQKKIALDN